MNKASFRWAFLALLASSLTGCASPMQLFGKKPSMKDFQEYAAQHQHPQRVAGSHSATGGQIEVAELLHKGHAAFQQGNLPEAQSNYLAIVQRQPNHPVANHRLAVIADRQQDYASAQRHYFAALQASPRDANLLNDVGYSFLLQSRYVEAEQYLQSALRQNATQSNAINNLGLLYAKQGRAQEALAMFRQTSSDVEAQAKLAKLLPSNAVTPQNTMLAQNPWAPQNAMNPAPTWNNGQSWSQEVAGGPAGLNAPNGVPPNSALGAWRQNEAATPTNPSGIAQAGGNFASSAISDPSLPDATRSLKEQMERERLKAVAERQARDLAERQRREFAARNLRDEELGRQNAMNPNSRPTTGSNWNIPPVGMPNAVQPPNGTIANGPAASNQNPNPNANPNNGNSWAGLPNGASPPQGYADLIPSHVPNDSTNLLPNAASSANYTSPLDTMPAWQAQDSAPIGTPNNSANGASSWPNANSRGMVDDPARAASRLGMNAGPGNLFQITPGPTSIPASAPNGPPAMNRPNNVTSPNGIAPVTPPNWPANSNAPNYGSPTGEPPAGSFGPSNFSTSANSQQLPESAAQHALQEQLPPSQMYQTPARFGFATSANTPNTPPASFASDRGMNGTTAPAARFSNAATSNPAQPANVARRDGARTPTSGQFGNPWEQGAPTGVSNPQTSSPIQQGFLPGTFGDESLLEYERMIQMQNAETNQIRQQLDAQRQLPGSENYYRSRPQSQAGTATGPRPQ